MHRHEFVHLSPSDLPRDLTRPLLALIRAQEVSICTLGNPFVENTGYKAVGANRDEDCRVAGHRVVTEGLRLMTSISRGYKDTKGLMVRLVLFDC